MDKDYLNFLERMGSFGMELGDQSDEIQHHGVIGQKWGVRRRVQSLIGSNAGRVSRDQQQASTQREQSWKKVYARRASMSTAELREHVNRLNLENQLRQQVNMVNPAKKSIARTIITDVGTSLIKSYANQVGQQLLKKAIEKTV